MGLSISEWLAVIGLTLDIIGAFFLAKGFMFKLDRDILEETSTCWNFNDALRNSLIRQRVEAIIGGIFLVSGFLFQISSYLHRAGNKLIIIGVLLLVSILLVGRVFYQISKNLGEINIVRLGNKGLLDEIKDAEIKCPSPSSSNLKVWGNRAGLTRLNGESDAEFLTRIKCRIEEELKPRFLARLVSKIEEELK